MKLATIINFEQTPIQNIPNNEVTYEMMTMTNQEATNIYQEIQKDRDPPTLDGYSVN